MSGRNRRRRKMKKKQSAVNSSRHLAPTITDKATETPITTNPVIKNSLRG